MPYSNPEAQKAAQKKYYEANKHLYAERNKIKRSKIRQAVIDIKSKTPCTDCGFQFPYYVMDFDHRPEFVKKFELSNLSNATSMQDALDEIAKCDVVCANCHRIRTHTRKMSGSATI